MDTSLNELYQEIIMDHNRYPRNKCRLPSPAKAANGYSPSCGDDVTVFVEMKNGTIKRITFDGEGCAISQASASLMTCLLTGLDKSKAEKIIVDICSFLGDSSTDEEDSVLERYGEVGALVGVKKFPMRIKCATLPWHAAHDAIS
ncbi:MAG: SUF system NifU family Fe-S cluster assembly protein [Puniceicoccales bacterium]|jgi:nitrogen fixation NifU-like protein|nr:SUF system NifU family Fe-S cluster assembly protein [Puniceicoccales bacterium]